jgi:hypothetical protein
MFSTIYNMFCNKDTSNTPSNKDTEIKLTNGSLKTRSIFDNIDIKSQEYIEYRKKQEEFLEKRAARLYGDGFLRFDDAGMAIITDNKQDEINWTQLSANPSAIALLEKNQKQFNWSQSSITLEQLDAYFKKQNEFLEKRIAESNARRSTFGIFNDVVKSQESIEDFKKRKEFLEKKTARYFGNGFLRFEDDYR